jgi:hypothetical protein
MHFSNNGLQVRRVFDFKFRGCEVRAPELIFEVLPHVTWTTVCVPLQVEKRHHLFYYVYYVYMYHAKILTTGTTVFAVVESHTGV